MNQSQAKQAEGILKNLLEYFRKIGVQESQITVFLTIVPLMISQQVMNEFLPTLNIDQREKLDEIVSKLNDDEKSGNIISELFEAMTGNTLEDEIQARTDIYYATMWEIVKNEKDIKIDSSDAVKNFDQTLSTISSTTALLRNDIAKKFSFAY